MWLAQTSIRTLLSMTAAKDSCLVRHHALVRDIRPQFCLVLVLISRFNIDFDACSSATIVSCGGNSILRFSAMVFKFLH